jgi:hypothetical protein
MIPYTTDYKKYVFALGVHRVRRLHDVAESLDLDLEISDDVTSSLRQVEMWLFLAAFVDDDAGNEIGWNLRELIRADAVNTYSDWRPVATTGRWDGGWVSCPSGPEILPPVIDVDDELDVSSLGDPDDIIDHLLDATEGIDAMREIDCDDKEQDR